MAHAVGLLAVGRFMERTVPRWPVWGPVALVGLHSLVWLENPRMRVLWCDAVLLGQWVLLTHLALYGGGRPLERGRWMLVLGGVLTLGIYVQRILALVLGHDELLQLQGSDIVQVSSHLLGIMGQIFASLGYVLMTKERSDAKYRQQALMDTLTGMPNRRALMQTLERALAQAVRERRPMALLMVDIDHFKRVNDTYGHLAGDAVLAAVARCLRDALRAQDFLGRYGGEEFLVLLPATDMAGAVRLAEHLRQCVQQMALPWEEQELRVTVSIGVHAQVPADVALASAMIETADQAMYAAKQAGRNRVQAQEALVPLHAPG
jgi:diguanylate cyclase (GGDEF)-like protein